MSSYSTESFVGTTLGPKVASQSPTAFFTWAGPEAESTVRVPGRAPYRCNQVTNHKAKTICPVLGSSRRDGCAFDENAPIRATFAKSVFRALLMVLRCVAST